MVRPPSASGNRGTNALRYLGFPITVVRPPVLDAQESKKETQRSLPKRERARGRERARERERERERERYKLAVVTPLRWTLDAPTDTYRHTHTTHGVTMMGANHT